jgi:hypothetical protein
MLSIDEAKAVMRSGLGKAELEFVTSITTPLWWVLREGDVVGTIRSSASVTPESGLKR